MKDISKYVILELTIQDKTFQIIKVIFVYFQFSWVDCVVREYVKRLSLQI